MMAFLSSLVPILCDLALGLTFKTDITSLVLMNFWSAGKGDQISALGSYSTATKSEMAEVTPNSIADSWNPLKVLSIEDPSKARGISCILKLSTPLKASSFSSSSESA
jgi:hypothetical protein